MDYGNVDKSAEFCIVPGTTYLVLAVLAVVSCHSERW